MSIDIYIYIDIHGFVWFLRAAYACTHSIFRCHIDVRTHKSGHIDIYIHDNTQIHTHVWHTDSRRGNMYIHGLRTPTRHMVLSRRDLAAMMRFSLGRRFFLACLLVVDAEPLGPCGHNGEQGSTMQGFLELSLRGEPFPVAALIVLRCFWVCIESVPVTLTVTTKDLGRVGP